MWPILAVIAVVILVVVGVKNDKWHAERGTKPKATRHYDYYDDNEDEFRYYILYRIEKSSTHFEKNYNSIAYIYLRNEVGKEYKRVSDELIRSVTPTDVLASLDHASIAMD